MEQKKEKKERRNKHWCQIGKKRMKNHVKASNKPFFNQFIVSRFSYLFNYYYYYYYYY